MLSLRQVVRAVKDAGGTRRFDADALRMSPRAFLTVVKVIRDADQRGFFEAVTVHRSARTGLVDLVIVRGLTKDGEEFIEAA